VTTAEELRDRYLAQGWWSATETLQERVRATAERSPTRLAAVDAQGRALSYASLDARADELAAGLRGLGLLEGDVVGMQIPNRVEALLVMCAIERAGGVVAPLMPMYRRKELEYIATAGRMRMLFVVRTYRGVDHEAIAVALMRETGVEHVISLADDEKSTARAPALETVHDLDAVRRAGRAELATAPLPALNPDAVAALMFTSGTTGTPKGVLHSHNTLLAGNRILSGELGLTDADAVFIPAVVGHGTGYVWGMRFSLFLGGRAVLLDTWEPERGARLLSEHGCSWTMVAPTFVQDLLDASGHADIDIRCLRYLSCGGAAPATSLHARAREELGCTLLRLYGQTEAFLSTHCLPSDPPEKLTSTEGSALPGAELQVLRADGAQADPDEPGELHARGPHRCVGLLIDGETRRLALDEWVPSGDLASIDRAGFLAVRGRIKEFINRGGFKYSPVEVEDLLHTHPGVARAAVIALPDERLGERACACVVPRQESLRLEDLTEFLRGQGMAPFKLPERLEVFDHLPQTPSGKVKKHVLVELVEQRAAVSS
jgi:non-ribosomal peptide synthetase component E (peptide arylation enzyme)